MTNSNAEKSRRLSRKWKAEGLCAHCGGDRDEKVFVICGKCRANTRRRRSDLILRREARGVCVRCGKVEPESGFKECAACSKRQYKYHSARPEYRKAQYLAQKEAAYQAYGGYLCACCGETEPMFLALDHIAGDGATHRSKIAGGTSLYQWLKSNGYPPGFQVLCHNCNMGKHLNKGVCPHKSSPACGDSSSGQDRKAPVKLPSEKQESTNERKDV